MGSGQFYMTLPSNSSMGVFPSNALSEYKVKLPEHLDLTGKWEVGLASITYPHTWFNLRKLERHFYFNGGDGIITVGLVPEGYYRSVSEVISAINREITGVKDMSVQLDKRSQKVTAILGKSQILYFRKEMGNMLGFGGEIKLTKTTTAPYVSNLNIRLQSLYVYLNIVESQIVGDVRAPLLRIVPAQGKDGEIITLNYDNPQYVPLSTRDFEVVEVLITDDTGEKVPFERGRVVITLNFRLRQSPYFQ